MKRHVAYLKYVLNHKWHVFVAGKKTGVSLWRRIIHDWSKFLPSEWFGYVYFFYNADGTSKKPEERSEWEKHQFERAWNFHQKRNKHHWNWWVLGGERNRRGELKVLPMREKYIREMVADWMAVSKVKTGSWEVADWLRLNWSSMVMHQYTQTTIDILLTNIEIRENLNEK